MEILSNSSLFPQSLPPKPVDLLTKKRTSLLSQNLILQRAYQNIQTYDKSPSQTSKTDSHLLKKQQTGKKSKNAFFSANLDV